VKFIKANAPAEKFRDLPNWIVKNGKTYEVQPQ